MSKKDNVLTPMFRHHKVAALTKALVDTVYEHGEGVSVAEVIGTLEFVKMHFIEEAGHREEIRSEYDD
jgi:hypothetical protein